MNVYFNVNKSTLIMWSITVVGMILLYEGVRYLLRLCMERRLRRSAAVLLMASIYPHYYSWWMYFNAYNDGFFKQMYHQVSTSHVSVTCKDHLPTTAAVATIMGSGVHPLLIKK